MSEFTGPIFALAGVALGHWLTIFRDQRTRRHQFRCEIQSLLVRLEKPAGSDLVVFHETTKDALFTDCAKLSDDIWRWKRRRFEDAARRYRTLTPKQIENPNSEHFMKYMRTEERPDGNLFDWELGRNRMRECFEELIRYAK